MQHRSTYPMSALFLLVTIVAVLVDTGIRADELCTLTIANTHLDARDAYVRVHGKGNKWREIGLGDTARRHLKTYLRHFRAEAAPTDIARCPRRDRTGARPLRSLRKTRRVPGRQRPVLPARVELVGRRAHAHPRGQQVLICPGVGPAGVRAHRQVPDHANAHARRPCRRLGRG